METKTLCLIVFWAVLGAVTATLDIIVSMGTGIFGLGLFTIPLGTGIAYSALTGPMPFGTNEGYAISVNPPAFLFRTNSTSNALYLSSSAAATHGGFVSYWDDDAS